MVLNYNLTGQKRKQLVGAISKELNKPTEYLGVPSFSYQVDRYTIDKNGVLTGPDNLDLEDALHQVGFDADEREYDEPDTYEYGLGGMGAVDEIPDIDQHHPGKYANPNVPITEVMQRQLDDVLDSVTIEMPRTGFTDTGIDNLKKLVANKSELIKKALGVNELPIIITHDKISFPWFRFQPGAKSVAAYTQFISSLCDMAKSQKRVNGKETTTDNEKFAFRTFLLRLGFIGSEFKQHRKILLQNLSGSSAFRNGGNDNV